MFGSQVNLREAGGQGASNSDNNRSDLVVPLSAALGGSYDFTGDNMLAMSTGSDGTGALDTEVLGELFTHADSFGLGQGFDYELASRALGEPADNLAVHGNHALNLSAGGENVSMLAGSDDFEASLALALARANQAPPPHSYLDPGTAPNPTNTSNGPSSSSATATFSASSLSDQDPSAGLRQLFESETGAYNSANNTSGTSNHDTRSTIGSSNINGGDDLNISPTPNPLSLSTSVTTDIHDTSMSFFNALTSTAGVDNGSTFQTTTTPTPKSRAGVFAPSGPLVNSSTTYADMGLSMRLPSEIINKAALNLAMQSTPSRPGVIPLSTPPATMTQFTASGTRRRTDPAATRSRARGRRRKATGSSNRPPTATPPIAPTTSHGYPFQHHGWVTNTSSSPEMRMGGSPSTTGASGVAPSRTDLTASQALRARLLLQRDIASKTYASGNGTTPQPHEVNQLLQRLLLNQKMEQVRTGEQTLGISDSASPFVPAVAPTSSSTDQTSASASSNSLLHMPDADGSTLITQIVGGRTVQVPANFDFGPLSPPSGGSRSSTPAFSTTPAPVVKTDLPVPPLITATGATGDLSEASEMLNRALRDAGAEPLSPSNSNSNINNNNSNNNSSNNNNSNNYNNSNANKTGTKNKSNKTNALSPSTSSLNLSAPTADAERPADWTAKSSSTGSPNTATRSRNRRNSCNPTTGSSGATRRQRSVSSSAKCKESRSFEEVDELFPVTRPSGETVESLSSTTTALVQEAEKNRAQSPTPSNAGTYDSGEFRLEAANSNNIIGLQNLFRARYEKALFCAENAKRNGRADQYLKYTEAARQIANKFAECAANSLRVRSTRTASLVPKPAPRAPKTPPPDSSSSLVPAFCGSATPLSKAKSMTSIPNAAPTTLSPLSSATSLGSATATDVAAPSIATVVTPTDAAPPPSPIVELPPDLAAAISDAAAAAAASLSDSVECVTAVGGNHSIQMPAVTADEARQRIRSLHKARLNQQRGRPRSFTDTLQHMDGSVPDLMASGGHDPTTGSTDGGNVDEGSDRLDVPRSRQRKRVSTDRSNSTSSKPTSSEDVPAWSVGAAASSNHTTEPYCPSNAPFVDFNDAMRRLTAISGSSSNDSSSDRSTRDRGESAPVFPVSVPTPSSSAALLSANLYRLDARVASMHPRLRNLGHDPHMGELALLRSAAENSDVESFVPADASTRPPPLRQDSLARKHNEVIESIHSDLVIKDSSSPLSSPANISNGSGSGSGGFCDTTQFDDDDGADTLNMSLGVLNEPDDAVNNNNSVAAPSSVAFQGPVPRFLPNVPQPTVAGAGAGADATTDVSPPSVLAMSIELDSLLLSDLPLDPLSLQVDAFDDGILGALSGPSSDDFLSDLGL